MKKVEDKQVKEAAAGLVKALGALSTQDSAGRARGNFLLCHARNTCFYMLLHAERTDLGEEGKEEISF